MLIRMYICNRTDTVMAASETTYVHSLNLYPMMRNMCCTYATYSIVGVGGVTDGMNTLKSNMYMYI